MLLDETIKAARVARLRKLPWGTPYRIPVPFIGQTSGPQLRLLRPISLF
jgi:hypothetical protein